MILVLFGPGLLIYFIAKTVSNKFVDVPYLGEHTYNKDEQGNITDTTFYTIPNFELTLLNGKKITKNSIKNKFVVLTTLQNSCPDTCGMYMFHFEELFYNKLVKNQSHYSNVKIISILTDHDGNPVNQTTDKFMDEINALEQFDDNIWWIATGDPSPLFSFKYNNTPFNQLPSSKADHEIGKYAFVNSLVLIDREGHIRGFTGAKSDSDIRNFFDILKILKKTEFDENNSKK